MTRGLAIFQNHMSTIIANKQWWQTRLRHSRQHLKYAFLTGKFLCFWGQTSAHQSLWNQNKRASCAKLCTFWNCSGLLTTQPDSTCCPRARFLFQHVLFSSSANLSAVKEGQPSTKMDWPLMASGGSSERKARQSSSSFKKNPYMPPPDAGYVGGKQMNSDPSGGQHIRKEAPPLLPGEESHFTCLEFLFLPFLSRMCCFLFPSFCPCLVPSNKEPVHCNCRSVNHTTTITVSTALVLTAIVDRRRPQTIGNVKTRTLLGGSSQLVGSLEPTFISHKWQFGRGTTLLRGLTNNGYYPLACAGMILQVL